MQCLIFQLVIQQYKMSKYSPNNRVVHRQNQQQIRKLEKSKTHAQGLQRTPSTLQQNPYLELMDGRPTDKKRKEMQIAYNAPVLIQQNQQLLTENREMALLIHQKNRLLEMLEKKYNEKLQNEIYIFKEVETEKKRFIEQILKHKEDTDAEIVQLSQLANNLQQEKADLQRDYNRQLKSNSIKLEEERKRELQQLTLQFQKSLSLANSQRNKFKEQLEARSNQSKIMEMESKHNLDQIAYQNNKLKDQIKHLVHVKKLEQAELKHFYQNKIQKLHLDNRREKQLFLVEHDSQMKKNDEELRRLRREIQNLEIKNQNHKILMQNSLAAQTNNKEKIEQEVESHYVLAKEQMYKQKQKLQKLSKAEHQCFQQCSKEEVKHLLLQNQKLISLYELRNEQINRLYSVIDELRERHLSQLQLNENIINQLQSKLYTNQILGIQENQIMKIKLANLRQTDIKTIKHYYEHQIKIISDTMHEQERNIQRNRQKYHQELKKKSEIRKYFDIEVIKYKENIFELEIEIKGLKAQLEADRRQKQKCQQLSNEQEAREERKKAKIEVIKGDQYKQFQIIVNSKDQQIDELQKKLKLLKEHHTFQLQQKDREVECQKQKGSLIQQQKLKNIQYFETEIKKIKQLRHNQKQQHQLELQTLNQHRKEEIQKCLAQLARKKQQFDQTQRILKNQIKKMNIQVAKLTSSIADKDREINMLKKEDKQHIEAQSKREREMLQQFYTNQLRVKDQEIADLNQRVQELTNDLRDGRENYNNLQTKLQQLIQSQSALREIEKKVLNMGKQNNLVKNIKEVVR